MPRTRNPTLANMQESLQKWGEKAARPYHKMSKKHKVSEAGVVAAFMNVVADVQIILWYAR